MTARAADEHEQSAQEKHWAEESGYWRQQKRVNSFTATFSFIAAGAAVVAAFYAVRAFEQTRRQANAAEAQIKITVDQEKRQLRAYVGIVTSEALNLDWNPLEIHWKIKNVGNTPAYHVHGAGNLRVDLADMAALPPPRPEEIRPTGGTKMNGTLSPQQEQAIILTLDDTRPKFLNREEKDIIRWGPKFLFAYGYMFYDDIFGETHTTAFRLEYGGPESVREGIMRWSAAGNDAN